MLDFEAFVRAYNSIVFRNKRYSDSHDYVGSWMDCSNRLTLSEYKKLYLEYCKKFTSQVATA